ncbi:hypothetical protein LTR93_011073 [Exophiala xenobiotica]|nr:hypothetical protein LTR93_011073 [Exophiala xenobiotica]
MAEKPERVKKVALAGATGMLGRHIWKAFADSGRFGLTVLIRSSAQPPIISLPGRLVEVDYDSPESLRSALQGQDVLISALGMTALAFQPRLFEAANAAGVKRIIPSEFGGDLAHPITRQFPTRATRALSAAIRMSYTLIFTNCLLDWGMSPEGALLLDPADRTVNLYDGGNHQFSTTSMVTVGKAVVAVLDKYEETANRGVYIQDVAVTQNELLQLAKEVTAGDGGPEWVVSHVDTAQLEHAARSDWQTGGRSFKVFYGFAVRGAFAPGYGGHFVNCDNELLGIKEMETDQLRELIRQCCALHS